VSEEKNKKSLGDLAKAFQQAEDACPGICDQLINRVIEQLRRSVINHHVILFFIYNLVFVYRL